MLPIVRAVANTPRARFERPAALRDAPGGFFAVSTRDVLHTVLDGNHVHGVLTPLVIAPLGGGRTPKPSRAGTASVSRKIVAVVDALRAKRLLP